MQMNTEQTIISIAIIGGVIGLFGSLGYACCYFKNKCRPLYEQDQEIVKLRPKRKTSGASDTLSTETADSGSNYRKTLFQISYGEGATEKPTRAKRKSPLQSLSFIRKSKAFNNTFKSLKRSQSKSCPPVEEDNELQSIPEIDPKGSTLPLSLK